MSDSDSLYHRLFSHPRMVEELVRQFVSNALSSDLDFSGLQRVNPKFHIGRRSAARREGDVIFNGAQRWSAPTEITELVGLEPHSRPEAKPTRLCVS
jgi:hypothetical protein